MPKAQYATSLEGHPRLKVLSSLVVGCGISVLLPINFLAITDFRDEDDSATVIDGVYDSIIALPNPIFVLRTREFLRSLRTWIVS